MKFKQTLLGMVAGAGMVLGSASSVYSQASQKYEVRTVEKIQYSKPDVGIDPVILGIALCGVYKAFQDSRKREIKYKKRLCK